MLRRTSLLLAVLSLLTACPAFAEDYPNWQSCSLDFWGNVKDL